MVLGFNPLRSSDSVMFVPWNRFPNAQAPSQACSGRHSRFPNRPGQSPVAQKDVPTGHLATHAIGKPLRASEIGESVEPMTPARRSILG